MRLYLQHGHILVSRRWRGAGGEIDLVMERGGEIVFVEVKKSRTHGRAAESLSHRQMSRLMQSAEACLGGFSKGSLTPMRIDVALVDDVGRIEILQNAIAA